MQQNTEQQIAELKDQYMKLKKDFDVLSMAYNKNNFTAYQEFSKTSTFTTALKVPLYTTLPSCEPGQICVHSTGGTYKLMVATASNTWTVVGTQS